MRYHRHSSPQVSIFNCGCPCIKFEPIYFEALIKFFWGCLVYMTGIKCFIFSCCWQWMSCIKNQKSWKYKYCVLKMIYIVDGDEDEVEGDRTSQSVKVIHFGLVWVDDVFYVTFHVHDSTWNLNNTFKHSMKIFYLIYWSYNVWWYKRWPVPNYDECLLFIKLLLRTGAMYFSIHFLLKVLLNSMCMFSAFEWTFEYWNHPVLW